MPIKSQILMIILLACAAPGLADPGSPAGFKPYLGLAVPVPENIPELELEDAPVRRMALNSFEAILHINNDGKVEKLDVLKSPDSLFNRVRKVQDDLAFRFLDGIELDYPVKLPVLLEYPVMPGKGSLRLRFPVSGDSVSHERLLARFIELNEIDLPQVVKLPTVNYKIDMKNRKNEYVTITAQVSLDSDGRLTALEFPVAGQDKQVHQVHVALINADFKPAYIKGRSFPCEFLLTFRIFDNIDYPFSPLMADDSAAARPLTEDYFMMLYLNPDDISLFPLPNRSATGKVISTRLGPLLHYSYQASVVIDTLGKLISVHSVSGGSQAGLDDVLYEVLSKIVWYPALDNQGRPIRFSGRITVRFNASDEVVYIPEWLND
jgi:hypothetical protein